MNINQRIQASFPGHSDHVLKCSWLLTINYTYLDGSLLPLHKALTGVRNESFVEAADQSPMMQSIVNFRNRIYFYNLLPDWSFKNEAMQNPVTPIG